MAIYSGREINKLERNYREIWQYSRLLKDGKISEEEFSIKKKELFEDNSWEEEYGKLKDKKAKKYTFGAYAALIMIYHDYGTVTDEEFEYYSKRLIQKMQ